MFAEAEWKNGFKILCDYRKITKFDLNLEDVKKVVMQDKKHELIFDQSKCAIVADADIVYGLSRMWEILSENNNLSKKIFRKINDAKTWLGLESDY